MRKGLWWVGENTTLSSRASDFILAMHGFKRALDRFKLDRHLAYSVMECAWWISAASEAAGERKDLLNGIYWVRSKGIHEITVALGQIDPGQRGEPMGVGTLGVSMMGGAASPSRWKRLQGPDDGGREDYNQYLAGRTIDETLDEAFAILEGVLTQLEIDSGLSGLAQLP